MQRTKTKNQKDSKNSNSDSNSNSNSSNEKSHSNNGNGDDRASNDSSNLPSNPKAVLDPTKRHFCFCLKLKV